MRHVLQQVVLDTLRKHGGDGVTLEDLIDEVYADDPDGGPEYAEMNVRIAIHRLRKLGLSIDRRSLYILNGRGHAS